MKLLLIDAYSQIFRAYYAFIHQQLTNSKGENISTLFGFFNTMEEVIRRLKPTHVGVAFDPKGGTFRHDVYPDYKAQRSDTPENILWSTPIIKKILEAYHIPVFEVNGYEADDVIGTLATEAGRQGIETYMLTSDKDYGQLVTDNVYMFRPSKKTKGEYEILDPETLCAAYGVQSPAQIIDFLALMGDASDNVPGCKGVGEKTALQLLEQFGSLDNLLTHSDEIKKPALRRNVEECREQIEFSRFLVTIKTDVPVELNMNDMEYGNIDTEALKFLFREYGLRALYKRKFGEDFVSAAPDAVTNKTITQNSAKSRKEDDGMMSLFDLMEQAETETQQLDAVSVIKKHDLIGYNLKAEGMVDYRKSVFDVMVAHYVLHPELKHDLTYIAETLLGVNVTDSNRNDVVDALYAKLEPLVVGNNIFNNIEMPLVSVLAQMEHNGVRLDVEALQHTASEMRERLAKIEDEAKAMVPDMEFNISSPKQVGELLFDYLKLDSKAKKTSSGQYTTDEKTMLKYADKHPIVELILAYRGIKKLLSTYVDALPALINPKTGKIHTTFNQAVTVTGRLSSSNPNLQNIPIREEEGRFIRSAFVPDEGEEWFSADYSQIELRLMAHLSGDETLIADFNSGHDIHAATAAKIFHKDISEVTREERAKAKTANFGIIYGITTFGLADRLRIPRAEAKALIEGYFATYPRVRQYMDECVAVAREKGYAETLMGRRCYLPDITSNNHTVRSFAERNAINAPIQGTAADIIKMAMIRVQQCLWNRNMKSKMILQVHDELNFTVPVAEHDSLQQMVLDEMQNVIKLRVPLIAEAGWGKTWLDAH